MPDRNFDETDLSRMFAETEVRHSIDPKKVITRSRARRLPRQIAAGGVGALALSGVLLIAVQTITPVQPTSMIAVTGEAGDRSEAFTDETVKRAPAERVNLCEAPIAAVAPSFYGLRLDVEFPSSVTASAEPVLGTVRLTNTSDVTVVGYTPATPALTLSQGGITVWHSNGPMIMSLATVDLSPGESMEYSASFTPVRCSVQDDLAEGFPPGLPAVPAGAYELSALIDFTADASMVQQNTPELDLVSGPAVAVSIQ